MSRNADVPTKTCATCGRVFAWRKKWERNWDDVRYCSDQCRREKPGKLDQQLEAAILDLLQSRERGSSICPSEAAKTADPDDWRSLMERTRRAARRLVRTNTIEITQGGKTVDPDGFRGPIRLRLRG